MSVLPDRDDMAARGAAGALSALAEENARLRELSAHAECVREADRTRIAREIHDELGSVLVALKLDLGWLAARLRDRPELESKATSMRRLIDNAVIEVGRIITDLRPSILDHQGLWAAMEWQAQEMLSSAGIEAHVELAAGALPPPGGLLATSAYRIFQEMLSNVVRHAQATRAWIHVDQQEQTLVIEVQDNGRGMSEAQRLHPHSFGLVGMQERAAHFGGCVVFEPRCGGGCCVRAELPLPSTPSPVPDCTENRP